MAPVIYPMYISSRLMAALNVDGAGTLHVHAGHRDSNGRVVYRYLIENTDGDVLYNGTDLSSGVGADVDYTEAMATVLSFLEACAEAGDDGENSDLFNPAVRAWAQQHSDELSMARCDIER